MRSIYNFFCTYQAILHCLQLFFKQLFPSSQGGVSDKFKSTFTHDTFRLYIFNDYDSRAKDSLRSAKNVVFYYSGFWPAGQWGGFSPLRPPLPPPRGYATVFTPDVMNIHDVSGL